MSKKLLQLLWFINKANIELILIKKNMNIEKYYWREAHLKKLFSSFFLCNFPYIFLFMLYNFFIPQFSISYNKKKKPKEWKFIRQFMLFSYSIMFMLYVVCFWGYYVLIGIYLNIILCCMQDIMVKALLIFFIWKGFSLIGK